MSRFKKAVRQQAKLRIGLDGPSGAGKSVTALRFALAFKYENPGVRVAAIEAGENSGLSLYQGMVWDGIPLEFDILELKGNYAPTEYTAAIEEAGRDKYDVLVIDSLSHAWAGAGGALEIKDKQGGNEFTAWRSVTPMHNRMIDAILQSPCHVIATLRSKTEYVMEETVTERGKRMVPRKVGLAPIQRAGMEYEFTIFGSMDSSHTLTITKSRCASVQDRIDFKPGLMFMLPIIQWLKTGEVVEVKEGERRPSAEEVKEVCALLEKAGWSEEVVGRGLTKHGAQAIKGLTPGQILGQLTAEQARKFKAVIEGWLAKQATTTATKTEEASKNSSTTPTNSPPMLPAPPSPAPETTKAGEADGDSSTFVSTVPLPAPGTLVSEAGPTTN